MTGGSIHRSAKIIGRFLDSAAKYPDRPALEKGPFKISYAELLSRAESIARKIKESGDDKPIIAVIADKSPECYAAILGILLAGKGYLPLNPRFPASRNRFMVEKTGVSGVIEGGELTSLVTSQVPSSRPDPAYVLFTSGTTGEPKGVQVSNSNLSAYIDFMLKAYDFKPDDRFTQNFDLTFDLSVHDLFLSWSSGACLCVPEDPSSFNMAKFIREKHPTSWFSVPSAVTLMDRMRLLKPASFPSIRQSFFCGEPLYVKTVEAWQRAATGSRIINLYGPTEATIAISQYEIPPDRENIKQEMGIVSIGKIFNGNAYILQGTSQVTSQVVRGELCLTGLQVVENYFDNPEADAQSFFFDGNSPDKYYKTGDLVKVDKEGDLFFLGRSDSEIKISGYRVNLREIENKLQGYDKIDQAVMTYEQVADEPGKLIAFIVAENKDIKESEVNDYCRLSLPWYMVPGKIIFVDSFPLNANGKIDRAALKERYLHEK